MDLRSVKPVPRVSTRQILLPLFALSNTVGRHETARAFTG